jgi:integrase
MATKRVIHVPSLFEPDTDRGLCGEVIQSGGASAIAARTFGKVTVAKPPVKALTRPGSASAKLSEDTVKRLPVPSSGNRIYYFASDVVQGATAPRGFGVRVTAAGTRSFVLNYRVAGKERRYTIGGSPDWSVLRAIRRARELRQEVDRGEDPVAARTASRAPAPKVKTVADVLADFATRYLRREGMRSGGRVERALNDIVKPAIGAIPIHGLRRIAITELLDKVEDERGPVAADRTLAYLRKALNWYAARDEDFNSPIVKGMARTSPAERARKRTLADDEIRDLWTALDLMVGPAPFPALVRALLLSAARRDEVAGMRWDEIDGDFLVVPAVRNKTSRENAVPLTPALRATIGAKPSGSGPYAFSTTNGRRPFSGYGKAKLALDATISVVREEAGHGPMQPWVLHDLRRTARSLMARAGVESNVAEMVLGHVVPGIRGVYDRYGYEKEKRDALERLAVLVDRILHPVDNETVRAER